MADTYLPADVRKRIVDVMRERKMTQRELALRIDVNESTISRFLSGKTEKLSEESVIRIARVFNVSTDFILGTTVIPDKKNYDISELGLSVEAAKNLYTGNTFMTVVKEIKKEAGSDLVAAKAISKEATEKMFAELTKGQDMQNPTITPEAVVDAITGSISGVDGVNQEALDNFNKALLGLMQTMVLPEDDGQDN